MLFICYLVLVLMITKYSNIVLNPLSLFIYFWLHWVFVAVCGLSLAAASGRLSVVVVRGLLIAVASLVAVHQH